MYLRARGLPRAYDRVLHCAAEPFLERALRGIVGEGYISVDLEEPRAMVLADLTALPFADASFELVLCSHVLEHVADDRAAMAEMARVLAPGGEAIVQSPVNHDQTWGTYEDPSLSDPVERLARFSQTDHVRVYGPDLRERLEEVGFVVSVERPAEEVSEQTVARLGLVPRVGPLRNELYRCLRPDGR
jgi:SAM-dependent methyltransferase